MVGVCQWLNDPSLCSIDQVDYEIQQKRVVRMSSSGLDLLHEKHFCVRDPCFQVNDQWSQPSQGSISMGYGWWIVQAPLTLTLTPPPVGVGGWGACRAKEEPIICTISASKNNFSGEHVFYLQSVWDLEFVSDFVSTCTYIIKSEANSQVPDELQIENVLSSEIIFRSEMAHNGFFLCTAEGYCSCALVARYRPPNSSPIFTIGKKLFFIALNRQLVCMYLHG